MQRAVPWAVLGCIWLGLAMTCELSVVHAETLPFSTVFRGESVFERLVSEAEANHWRELPLGDRTAAVGRALLGTPYRSFTLEIDDHIEAPSVDLLGLDCWTFFETAVGFARMLEAKPGNYQPEDLLAMIELDRYRGGRCTGIYTSRLHHLEDWIHDNQRRGLVRDLTRSLGGVPMYGHYDHEMSTSWRRYRYLSHDVSLIPQIEKIEAANAARTNYHIPKDQVTRIESQLKSGDVICISSALRDGFTEHVGLAYRDERGVLRFMHASKDERQVIIDAPLHRYLYRYRKFGGIMVARPEEVRSSSIAG